MFEVNGNFVDCTSPVVDGDIVRITADDGVTKFKDDFDCLDEAGTTFGLDEGTYDVTLDILQCPNTAVGCPGGAFLQDGVTFTNIDVIGGTTVNVGNVIWQF
jgi:hypothetical protein